MEIVDASAHSAALAAPTATESPACAAPSRAAAGEAENIAVCIRVRPLNERELRTKDTPVLRSISAMNLISVTDTDGQPLPGKHNVFQYDHIFDERASTRAMYKRVAQRIVKSSLDGINGTIFAYGQTSSGKTYTMTGTGGLPFAEDDQDDLQLSGAESMGILQLAVEDIFSFIEQSTDRDFLLRVSFVEIYNEVIKDLLNPSEKGSNLKVREDPRKGVYVESKEEIITNYEDILRLLHIGNQRRSVGQTAMNERSSRSHSIFRIVIESKQKNASRRQSEDDVNGAVLVASLSLVDLAGSESVRHTAAEGARQREAGNINKSLLTLSRVINALASSAGAMNAPFRDSKLTRLLQTSLDGNTRTLIICCVTPSDRFLEETKSTLQFAARAKTIQTSAHVNEILDDQAQLKRLKKEVHELRKMNNAGSNAVSNTEAFNALKAENEALHNEQSKNKTEIARLLSLVLSSTSDSVRGLASARKLKKRNKRMRETWHPGDFPAHVIAAKLAEMGSPNPQSRKRQLQDDWKENINPQNLLCALDDAVDDDDDEPDMGTSKRFRRMNDENEDPLEAVSRRRKAKKTADDQVRQVVELLERTMCITQPEDELDDLELDARVMRLVSDTRSMVAMAQNAQHFAGELEVTKMAVEELQVRLQLSSDQVREETLAWSQEKATLEAEVAQLRAASQCREVSDSRDQDGDELLRSLLERNDHLQLEVSRLSEAEASWSKQMEELSSQLQDAFVEQETLKLEKDEEIAKLEEELLAKTDELEQKLAEFALRESELIAGQERVSSSKATALAQRCDELQLENDRVIAEKSSLTDAMESLEEQLQQTARARDELVERLQLTEEQAAANNDQRAGRSIAEANDRIAQLERELAQAQDELIEAGNDQEAEASRADQVAREMEELITSHAAQLADLREDMERHIRQIQELEAQVAEKEEMVKQSQAAEAEARGYRDFLQTEMDELSQKAASFEATKTQLTHENFLMRQQLSEVNKLANEIEGLTECIESLQADVDIKTAKDKQQMSEIKRLTLRVTHLEAEVEAKTAEVARLNETLQALDEEKSVWLQKGATSDELHGEIVRMREERWGLATKWEESDRMLTEVRRELESTVSELRDLQIEYKTLEESTAMLKDVVQADEAKLRQLASELDATTSEKEALEDMVGELESKFEVLALAKKTLDESLAGRMAEVSSKTSENEALRAQLVSIQSELETAQQQRSGSITVDSTLEQKMASLELQCEALLREKNSLADDAKMAQDGQTALVEELGALEAQLMAVAEEKSDLQSRMDTLAAENKDLRLAYDSMKENGSSSALTAQLTSPDLHLRLEQEQQRRVKAELDAKSYAEALEMLQEDLKRKSDAHKSLELAFQQATADKTQSQEQLRKLRADFARAKEEQDELRYQNQQRLVANSDSVSHATEHLESELAAAKEALTKMEEKWKGRAQQAEAHFSRFQEEIQVAKDREEALLRQLEQSSEQLNASEEAKTKLEHEWKARVQQTDDRLRRLQAELDDTNERLSQTSESSHELIRVQHELDAILLEKKRVQEELSAREIEWQQYEGEFKREVTNLQVQCQETQEELEAYQKFANEEILKLRASIEENDAEFSQLTRSTKLREDALLAEIDHLKMELNRADDDVGKLQAMVAARDENESELRDKVQALTRQVASFEEEQAEQSQHYAQLKAAMDKLEGEDYQHRNELEEMAESLKSAQMEAMHYHNQLVEAQVAKEAMDKLVSTQKQRIDKLEKVKMTTETLELFRKLKGDRQDLQAQVHKLTVELEELAASKTQSKEASEQQHARLMRLKEEEISMFKTHVEELKHHIDELKRSLQHEKDKHQEARKEMQSAVDDLRDKAAQEVEDMRTVLKEKSDQVVELEDQLRAMHTSHIESMQEHKTAKESYLEKENLELLVENRKLKKRLDGRGGAAPHHVTLDDDEAVFAASAKAAQAVLGEPEADPDHTTPDAKRGGLASFLLSSGSSTASGDEDENEARPACSQQ